MAVLLWGNNFILGKIGTYGYNWPIFKTEKCEQRSTRHAQLSGNSKCWMTKFVTILVWQIPFLWNILEPSCLPLWHLTKDKWEGLGQIGVSFVSDTTDLKVHSHKFHGKGNIFAYCNGSGEIMTFMTWPPCMIYQMQLSWQQCWEINNNFLYF